VTPEELTIQALSRSFMVGFSRKIAISPRKLSKPSLVGAMGFTDQLNIGNFNGEHLTLAIAKDYGKATHVKFAPNTGAITAEYTLYGVPTST